MTTALPGSEGKAIARNQKYLGLQVLRVIACFFVLVYHATLTLTTNDHSHLPVWQGGIAGVDLFFVLSGFVMLSSADRLSGVAGGWKRFTAHRIVRIVPLYWMVTLIFLAGGITSSKTVIHRSYFPGWVFGSFLLLPFHGPNGQFFPICPVGWTLIFEMFFYLLVGLALLLGRRSVLPFVAGTLLLLSTGWFLRKPNWVGAAYYLDPIVLEFVFGMVIYRLCSKGRILPLWVAVLLPLLALLNFLVFPVRAYGWRAAAIGLPAAAVVFSFASLESKFARVPLSLLFLADSTYVLYLVHEGVNEVITRRMVHTPAHFHWLILAACFTVSVALACLLRRYVELPVQKVLSRRIERLLNPS